MKFKFTSLKKYQKIAAHIMVWTALFLLPYIFALQAEDGRPRSAIVSGILILNTLMNVFWAFTFYFNSLVLIPRFLYQRKFLIFVLANAVLLIVILAVNWRLYHWFIDEKFYSVRKALMFNGFPFLFFLLVSIAFRTVSDRIEMERVAKERERENLKSELSFLRSQISPHFLFNVLNSIVAMVRLKSEELEPTILKLSSLMQYMLYETDDEKVLLKNEVEYLQSYIDLQKMRFGNRLTLNTHLRPKEDWHAVEPMLLIPFVENAFKHGTGMIENPIIEIDLRAEQNTLLFEVRNKYQVSDTVKDKVSGIGLANVQRRLKLLYGDNQDLHIDATGEWFTVALKLNLEP